MTIYIDDWYDQIDSDFARFCLDYFPIVNNWMVINMDNSSVKSNFWLFSSLTEYIGKGDMTNARKRTATKKTTGTAKRRDNTVWCQLSLSDKDVNEIEGLAADVQATWGELATIYSRGYDVLIQRNPKDDNFRVMCFGDHPELDDTRVGLSAYADDRHFAVAILVYKFFVLAGGEPHLHASTGNRRNFG